MRSVKETLPNGGLQVKLPLVKFYSFPAMFDVVKAWTITEIIFKMNCRYIVAFFRQYQ